MERGGVIPPEKSMRVQFIKDCPCVIDKRHRMFYVGNFFEASDSDAEWLTRLGYAIEVPKAVQQKAQKLAEPVAENKAIEPEENKSAKPRKRRGRPKAKQE